MEIADGDPKEIEYLMTALGIVQEVRIGNCGGIPPKAREALEKVEELIDQSARGVVSWYRSIHSIEVRLTRLEAEDRHIRRLG